MPDPSGPALRLVEVDRRFGDTVAVDGLDLSVPRGLVTALLGPSGCGKTTTLRCIAGLERIDGGRIEADGRTLAGPGCHVPPEQRRIGMVFQDYALFPHLDVQANVQYGLTGWSRAERRRAASEALALVGMAELGERLPSQLSGGQQQRVALARALAPRPGVILLDEPFSNLDAALRVAVREDVRRILRTAGATAVFVTHDQEEALSLADRVAVMADGRLHQVAPPYELYTRPATAFVARFVGDADVLAGTRIDDHLVETPLGRHRTTAPVNDRHPEVMVRPETLELVPRADGSAVVEAVTYFGHDQLVQVRLRDGTVVRSRQGPQLTLRAGDVVDPQVVGPVVAFSRSAPALAGAVAS